MRTLTVLKSTLRRWPLSVSAIGFLAISALMFQHIWLASPLHSTTCACADPSLFIWMFEWARVALSHGLNPFYSHAMFVPAGINLLSNTGLAGLTVPFVPLTALFGPVFASNCALLLAPVASALSMTWVARRWVGNHVAASLAGLLYGFSPLVLFHAGVGHLNLIFLPVPPLVLACCDELFWRREHSPRKVGLALAGLAIWQFFLSTEILTILVLASALSLLTLGTWALLTDREALVTALRHARPGLVVAVGVATATLLAPTIFALAGPSHYSGAIWPQSHFASASLRSFFEITPGTDYWWTPMTQSFARPTLIGVPILVLCALGLWRGSLRMRVAVVLSALLAWCALGAHYSFSLWHWIGNKSLLANVMNERFSALLFLPLALVVALFLDEGLAGRSRGQGEFLRALCVLVLLFPLLQNATRALPYGSSAVWEPAWYHAQTPEQLRGRVILGFPFFNVSANLLAVQAAHHMEYSLVGGTTPQWLPERQGAASTGYRVIWWLASTVAPSPDGQVFSPTSVSSIDRQTFMRALSLWGVSDIVIPWNPGPNTSLVARAPREIMTWIAGALGRPPLREHQAWVWHRSANS